MKLFVGLGNPGLRYRKTRHNAGFMFVDAVARDFGLKFIKNSRFNAELAEGKINGEKILLCKPLTFMNLSGEAVLAVVNFYKIAIDDVYIIYDDLDLASGVVRLRKDGSSGGHKGMQSIINLLHTQAIQRIRLGIDKAEPLETIDYVLGKFTREQKSAMQPVWEEASAIIKTIVSESFDHAMNMFNRGV